MTISWVYRFAWLPIRIGNQWGWLRWYAVRKVDQFMLRATPTSSVATCSTLYEYSFKGCAEWHRWETYIGSVPIRFSGPWKPTLTCIDGTKVAVL